MLNSIIYLNNIDVKGINSVLSIFVKSLQKQGCLVGVSEKGKSRDADWSASRQIGICYSRINPYLPIKYRYTRLITTPTNPYNASIISVVFKIGKNISYMKFTTINRIPTIIVETYSFPVDSNKYPISVHIIKLNVKLVIWELITTLIT